MNVKDLILTTAAPEAEKVETTPKARKKPAGPTWEVVLEDACDAAVRRKTARTSQLLVLLMSKGQFYIKDEVTDTVEKLDADNLAKFLRGANDLGLRPVKWSTSFTAKKTDAERFVRTIEDENFQWLAKRGLHVYKYDNQDYADSRYQLERKRNRVDNPMTKLVRKVCEEFVGAERVREIAADRVCNNELERKVSAILADEQRTYDELDLIKEQFGLDWARAYLRAFLAAPFVGVGLPQLTYYAQDIFDLCNFEPRRFVEYLLHDSVMQGYGRTEGSYRYGADLEDFARTWRDTLRMQKQTRNKVYDKYPDELDSMHRKLSFKVRLMSHQINEQSFKEHSERLMQYAKHDSSYTIRPPYNKEDIVDEAQQQANCLASYIDAYTENLTDLYFMRDSMDPEKSLVTVEVRDGRIRQAYRARNCRPSDEELKWLNEWAEEMGFKPIDADHQHPMAA